MLIAVAAFRVRDHYDAKETAHARHVRHAHVRWSGWCLVAGLTDGLTLISRAVHAPVTVSKLLALFHGVIYTD